VFDFWRQNSRRARVRQRFLPPLERVGKLVDPLAGLKHRLGGQVVQGDKVNCKKDNLKFNTRSYYINYKKNIRMLIYYKKTI
jgi:hypothetical protein